jgi:hypothetical protein
MRHKNIKANIIIKDIKRNGYYAELDKSNFIILTGSTRDRA